jgi:hypothetical protein
LPKDLFANLGVKQRLKVAVVVSGGNPDPAQLESVRAEIAREQGDAKPSGDRFASKHDRSDSSHDRSDSSHDRSDSGRDRSDSGRDRSDSSRDRSDSSRDRSGNP